MYARPDGLRGEPLDFQVSGRLWRDTLIFFDTETETLWSQLLGSAVHGDRSGEALEHVPSSRMSWAEWKELHPATRALAKPAELKASHYQRYFDAADKLGISGEPLKDQRLPGKHAVLGLGGGESALAVALAPGKRGVLELELGGETVFVVREDERGAAWRAPGKVRLRRSADGEALAPRQGTGRWHPWTGAPLAKDTEALEAVPAVSTYWFTWSRYHPGTALRR